MKNLLLVILFGIFSFHSFSVLAWDTPSTRFTLKQSENNTALQYNWKTLYQWSHNIQNNPFVWDEGCDALSEKRKENMDRQKAWESLWQQGQKSCLKENYFKTISVERVAESRFYTIKKLGYEWIENMFLFDSKTQRLHKKINGANWMDSITRIEVGNTGIYIQYSGGRWNSGWLVLIRWSTNKWVSLFSNTDDSENITMKSFELMLNRKVKVIYTKWGNSEVFEKIISIK